jgi:hypothetical protein
MAGRVQVFIATSLDGFIAGPGDDLSWLPGPGDGPAEDTFTPFLEGDGTADLRGRLRHGRTVALRR